MSAMGARPAPAPVRPAAPRRPAPRRDTTSERRRRERHFARRRRDLLEDAGVATLLAIVLLVATAGLGIVALIMLLVGATLVASKVAPRMLARRRARTARGGRRPLR